MNVQIKASYKQIQIKANEATIQFTVVPGAKGFGDLVRLAGQDGLLTFEPDQTSITYDAHTGEIVE